ncbi:MAG TPA: ATP-binding cassette domain-containing protein, partial [Candidatus Methylomirabilis sp.]|nr:ATP-binding cassette domain-containing protein [Candidatus Methylomirabilis sp.]
MSILELRAISKHFGAIHALDDVSLTIAAGEVVGLMGDNGAGKSTLVKILTGVFPPTSGELYIADHKVDTGSYSVKKAHALGIETVYQDKSLGEKQVMWRNFFIGRELTYPLGFLKVKAEKEIAAEIMLDTIGFRGKGIGVDSKASKLS